MSDSVAEHYMGEVEKRNKRIAELEAERDRLREAIKIQALKTAYYNGHGKANSIDLTQRYPTGELLYERYLCDEAKKALAVGTF